MKRPNGSGTVYKLKGNRRKPWVARKTIGWKKKGIPIYAFVGYYATRKEALKNLEHFNLNPSDRRKTFGECSDEMLAELLPTLSVSSSRCYKAAEARCDDLRKMKMSDVKLADMQPIFSGISKSVGLQTKTYLMKVFGYAVRHEILPVERPQIVRYIKLPTDRGNVLKRQIFAPDEMSKVTDPLTLILLYTGMRVGELLSLEEEDIHLSERWLFVRKSKTEAGVRTVPIAEKIVPMFDALPANVSYETFKQRFVKMFPGHLPHDTRHTFISRMADLGVDERITKAIVGHAGSGVTETVYTHLDLKLLLDAVNKLA